MKILESQSNIVVQKIKRFIPSLSGKTIGVLGLDFKSRADPSIGIINALLSEGVEIKAFDPLAINRARKIFGEKIKYARSAYEAAQNADAIIILAGDRQFKDIDLNKIKRLLKSPKIIDTRGIFNSLEAREKGFQYFHIAQK